MNKRIHGQWQGKEVERARHQQLNVSSGSDVRHFSLYSLAKASHMVIFNFKEEKKLSPLVFHRGKGNQPCISEQSISATACST